MRAKKSVSLKAVVILLTVVLLIGCTVGGTLAWLAVKTEPVVNTFSTSDITISLDETTEEFKMVPGTDIDKDPAVTVAKGSEPCYVFVKINESANLDDYIRYDVDSAWKAVSGAEGVYYCTVDVLDADADMVIPILVGDKVHVLDDVTKDMMSAANTDEPELTFTAYAVQQAGFDTAEKAWTEASKLG